MAGYAKITKSDIYIVVNIADFQNVKICQIFLLLWRLEYVFFRDEILHIG
jgi:hypothetical protein